MIVDTVGVTGNLSDASDNDAFRVDLEKDKYYRIDMKGSPTGDGTLQDPAMSMRDTSFDPLLDNGPAVIQTNQEGVAQTVYNDEGGTGSNARIDLQVKEAGTYYIITQDSSGFTGTYRLVVTSYDSEPP